MPPRKKAATAKSSTASKADGGSKDTATQAAESFATTDVVNAGTDGGSEVALSSSVDVVDANGGAATGLDNNEESETAGTGADANTAQDADPSLSGAASGADVPASTGASGDGSGKAEPEDPEEAKKRARAAKFGVPYVPPVPKAQQPQTQGKAKAGNTTNGSLASAPTGSGTAAKVKGLEGEKTKEDLGVNEEVMKKRQERFGVVEPLPTQQKGVKKAPAEKEKEKNQTAKQPEEKVTDPAILAAKAQEEQRRLSRAERFGTDHLTEEEREARRKRSAKFGAEESTSTEPTQVPTEQTSAS